MVGAGKPEDGAGGGGLLWVHENPWFRVGLLDGYYRLEPTHPWVAVLPRIGEDFLLVRVHRPLLGTALPELPAGGGEPGETLRAAIRRELSEEAGIFIQDLDRFRELPPLAVLPDRIAHWPALFQIELTEEEFAGRLPHDEEIAEVLRLDPATLIEWVVSGKIQSCLTLAVLFRQFCMAPARSGRTDG